MECLGATLSVLEFHSSQGAASEGRVVLAMYDPTLGQLPARAALLPPHPRLRGELVTFILTMNRGREWFKSPMLTPSTNHRPGWAGDGPIAALAAGTWRSSRRG